MDLRVDSDESDASCDNADMRVDSDSCDEESDCRQGTARTGRSTCDESTSSSCEAQHDIDDQMSSSSTDEEPAPKRACIAPVNRAGPSNIGVRSHCSWSVRQLQAEGLMARLARTLRKLMPPIRCGSLCSGIDVGIFCLLMLQSVFKDVGFQVDFEHTFCCELDDTIRQKLLEAYPSMRNLFEDVVDVATGTAFCEKLQDTILVPSVDVLIAGFSCIDLSTLNNRDVSFGDSDSTTGECYRATVAYITTHKPSFIILENVVAVFHRKRRALKPCVAQIIEDMRRLGYVGGVHKMDTREYGLPQRRNRAYMLFSRLGASTVPASHWYVPDAIAIRTSQNLERFKCTAKPLAYFLTDLEAGAKYFNSKPVHKTTAAKMTKWLEKANLLEADVVALETSPSFLPAIRSHRVRWLIAFHMLRLKKAGIDATSVPIVLQVDQRADRVPCVGAGPPVVPCVTTKGVYFVTSLNKFLNGEELLQLQGLSLQDQVKLGLRGLRQFFIIGVYTRTLRTCS